MKNKYAHAATKNKEGQVGRVILPVPVTGCETVIGRPGLELSPAGASWMDLRARRTRRHSDPIRRWLAGRHTTLFGFELGGAGGPGVGARDNSAVEDDSRKRSRRAQARAGPGRRQSRTAQPRRCTAGHASRWVAQATGTALDAQANADAVPTEPTAAPHPAKGCAWWRAA